jgi:hypothetical protein
MKVTHLLFEEELVRDAIVRIPYSELVSQGNDYLGQFAYANKKTLSSTLKDLKPVPDNPELKYGILPKDDEGNYNIIIFNDSNHMIGSLNLHPVEQFPLQPAFTVGFVTVSEDWRGMGIANTLYKIALRDLNIKLLAGEQQTAGGRKNWIGLSKTPGVTISGWGWVEKMSTDGLSNEVKQDVIDIQKKFEKSMAAVGAKSLGLHDAKTQWTRKPTKYHWYLFPVHAGEKEFKVKSRSIKIYYNNDYDLPYAYDVGLVAYWGEDKPVLEAPLTDYEPIGDFDKPGPFRNLADKKLAVHPTNIQKAFKFFEKTPYDFRIFPANVPGTSKYKESGEASAEKIKQIYGKDADKILNGSDDAINIIYIGNSGDARAMFTPWIMAHRFGHSIQATNRYNRNTQSPWTEAEQHFFNVINNTLEEYYGKVSGKNDYSTSIKWNLTPEYNALFNAIGTQRSSRTGQIRRPYEFLYEMFAQYLKDGKVTLNPLPMNLTYGRKVWGNPTKFMNLKPQFRDENERQYATEILANDLTMLFSDVLSHSVGKFYLM